MSLNTIDLFSGIGGISLALKGLTNTILYCDVDPIAQDVLTKRMASGHIDLAPIVNDVRNIDDMEKIVGDTRIDLIINSSSCVGFSTVGQKQGLDNPETGMMREALKVIEKFKPRFVFMENVPGILTTNNGNDLEQIRAQFSILGYDVSWTVVSASQLGAWHLRKRWFCLAHLKDDYGDTNSGLLSGKHTLQSIFKYIRYNHWTIESTNVEDEDEDENKKQEKAKSKQRSKALKAIRIMEEGERDVARTRMRLLGNSVVPDCVRYAFLFLFTGDHRIDIETMSPVTLNLMTIKNEKYVSANIKRKSKPSKHTLYLKDNEVDLDIIIDPFKEGIPPPTKYMEATSGLVTEELKITRYPTPVAQNVSPSARLTNRCRHDLHTVVKFQKGVIWSENYMVNPQFVEFLMGFPIDYTK